MNCNLQHSRCSNLIFIWLYFTSRTQKLFTTLQWLCICSQLSSIFPSWRIRTYLRRLSLEIVFPFLITGTLIDWIDYWIAYVFWVSLLIVIIVHSICVSHSLCASWRVTLCIQMKGIPAHGLLWLNLYWIIVNNYIEWKIKLKLHRLINNTKLYRFVA